MALIGHAIARGNAATHAVTAGFNSTGATVLVVGTVDYGGASPATLTDLYNNTWVGITPSTVANGRVKIYYCSSPITGAGHTVDFGGAGATYPAADFLAFDGFSVKDLGGSNTNEVSGAGSSLGAINPLSPAEAGELIVYFLGGNPTGTITVDTASILDASPIVGGESFGLWGAYHVHPTTTALQPAFAWTGGSAYASAALVSFKVSAGGGGTTYPVTIAESTASSADTPSSFLAQFAVPISDVAASGWLPSTGGTLFPMLDEALADFSDYIYSPNNPTTQQFEVKLAPWPDPGTNANHSIEISLVAMGIDTNFDFKLVQGTTVLDSWTEFVTVAQGQVTRMRIFSSAVIATITDRSDVRIRGVARA